MSRRVLWILFCSLLTVVRGLDNCLPSREAYANLSLGNSSDVPENFTSSINAQICTVTSRSCCPLPVEQSIDRAAFANLREFIPEFSLYLNESDINLFPNYDYIQDVVIEAIRDYFELSVPANADNIRTILNRITRQLNNIQLNNRGSNFPDRMKDLFSFTYLERMRGLYDLNSTVDYNDSFIECAMRIIEENQISDEITRAIDVMEYHFRSLYYTTELLYSIYIVFFHLESNLPFFNCARSFAELFYCHICSPETATLFPCRNVCKNVLSGCTIFLHVTGEEIIDPLQALCRLNTMTSHPLWNLHTILEVINNELYSIFDTSIGNLLQIGSSVSSCSEAPPLAAVPTLTDNPNRTTVGRIELLSSIPTSLTRSLHNILVTNLSSMFLDFKNITQRILDTECRDFPENDGSLDFECWRRGMSSTTDVEYLGIDFQAVLFDNEDLNPPAIVFINNFNTSVAFMRSNATRAAEFIDSISANVRVNVDNCNSSFLAPPPTIPPTTTVSTSVTISTTLSTTTTIESSSKGYMRTGFSAIMLLLLVLLLLILFH